MGTINSHEALDALGSGHIVYTGDYAFNNPDSINGPFGTFHFVLTSTGDTSGNMVINTLFGLGSVTNLVYQGTSKWNPSTGYTSVTAVGKGTITVRPNPPRPITAKIDMELEADFQHGTVSIEGFGKFPCHATATVVDNSQKK